MEERVSRSVAEFGRGSLYGETLAEIQTTFADLGLAQEGRPLDPARILVPETRITGDNERTLRNFVDLGLPTNFRIVYVRPPGQKIRENVIHASVRIAMMDQVEDYDEDDSAYFSGFFKPARRRPIQLAFLNLTSLNLFGQRRQVSLAIVPGEKGPVVASNPMITKEPTLAQNDFLEMPRERIMLGATRDFDHTLLISPDEDGKIHLDSLRFPKDWQALVENGRLVEKSAQPEAAASSLITDDMQSLASLIVSREWSSDAYAKIRQKVESFPRYSGIAQGKERVRVAFLGEAQTAVEMQALDDKIVMIFHGLDTDKLERLCREETLSVFTLASCFSKSAQSPDELVVEVALDRNRQVEVQARIVRWDPASRAQVDSLPYLSWSIRQSEQLKEVLADQVWFLPYFFCQLKPASIKPMTESGARSWELERFYAKKRRSFGRKKSGGSWQSSPTLSVFSQPASSPRETVAIPRRDTPEAKKKYWEQKAQRSKGTKVKAKHAAKK